MRTSLPWRLLMTTQLGGAESKLDPLCPPPPCSNPLCCLWGWRVGVHSGTLQVFTVCKITAGLLSPRHGASCWDMKTLNEQVTTSKEVPTLLRGKLQYFAPLDPPSTSTFCNATLSRTPGRPHSSMQFSRQSTIIVYVNVLSQTAWHRMPYAWFKS